MKSIKVEKKPMKHYTRKPGLLVNFGSYMEPKFTKKGKEKKITKKARQAQKKENCVYVENAMIEEGISQRVINLAKFFFFNEKWDRIIKAWGIASPLDLLQEVYPYFLEEKQKGFSFAYYTDLRRDYIEQKIENSKNEENTKYWMKRMEKLENEILLNSPVGILEEEEKLERVIFSRGFYQLRQERRRGHRLEHGMSVEISTDFQEIPRERFCEGYSEENEIISKLDLQEMGILESRMKVWTKDPQGITIRFVNAWKKDSSWKQLEEYIKIDNTWKDTMETTEQKVEGLFTQGFENWKFTGISGERMIQEYFCKNTNWKMKTLPESSVVLESPLENGKITRYILGGKNPLRIIEEIMQKEKGKESKPRIREGYKPSNPSLVFNNTLS